MKGSYKVRKIPFNEKPGYYKLLWCVVSVHSRLVMYSKLVSKYTVHIRTGKIFHRKRCLNSPTVEVTLNSYYAPYPAEGRALPKAINGQGLVGCICIFFAFVLIIVL